MSSLYKSNGTKITFAVKPQRNTKSSLSLVSYPWNFPKDLLRTVENQHTSKSSFLLFFFLWDWGLISLLVTLVILEMGASLELLA
jgi:hypothetical protein